MASSKNNRPTFTALLLMICLACSAQENTQAPPIHCRPDPIARPAIDPGLAFWRAHPEAGVVVAFQLHVAPDGSVSDVRLLPGDYGRDYAKETVKAVRKWTFKPFTCAPDGVWLRTRVRFEGPDGIF